MTRTDRPDQPLGGTAAELPPGYIRRAMSDDVDDSLADILAPRRSTKPSGAQPEGRAPESGAPTAVLAPTRPEPVREPAPKREPAKRPAPATKSGAPAVTPPKPRRRSSSETPHVIRPSVVHVSAHLLPLVAAERQRSGRSNGEILIAAIEDGHHSLTVRHESATRVGGQLFEARVTKPRPPVDEPLSPLNIRLYAEDFEVLDRLVAELGVGSRSRLATLALSDYLGAPSVE